MKRIPNFQSRKEAAEYWDRHGVDEHEDEAEVVEVQIKKPLSTILSLRIDEEHLEKLKLLARIQQTGITTIARKLLIQALDKPGEQLFFKALADEQVRAAVNKIWEDAQIPPGPAEPAYFILSKAQLDTIAKLINEAATRILLEALREKSLTITQEQPELMDKIRELEGAHR